MSYTEKLLDRVPKNMQKVRRKSWKRNGFMLKGKLAKHGYDWWWHSLVGTHESTKEQRPFFVEYFIVNPLLGGDKPLLAQLPEVDRPSYGMLKAGSWGKDNATQLHNFYPIAEVEAERKVMDVKIGPHKATETHLRGAVAVTPEEVASHPEWMTDAGSMSWDLKATKVLCYNVGYGAGQKMRALNAFQMYWHAQGQLTHYEGEIWYNGERYVVRPETSHGYQDKNWGLDFTNPWVWLNCNNFTSEEAGERQHLTSLNIGGGRPVVFGKAFPRKFLVAFFHEGVLHEYNFSKFWDFPKQKFDVETTDSHVVWDVAAWKKDSKIEVQFQCPKDHMLLFNYENPAGEKKHDKLWNGGHAEGVVKFYQKKHGDYQLIDTFHGSLGGCEYGEHSPVHSN